MKRIKQLMYRNPKPTPDKPKALKKPQHPKALPDPNPPKLLPKGQTPQLQNLEHIIILVRNPKP